MPANSASLRYRALNHQIESNGSEYPQQKKSVVRLDLVGELRVRQDRDVNPNADLRQHDADHAPYCWISTRSAVEPHAEAPGVAGLGEQRLGFVGIVGQAAVKLL